MKIDLDNIYKYHAPTESQKIRYESLRKKAKEFAELINIYGNDGREKSLAMTKLEESVMWANASIARNE